MSASWDWNDEQRLRSVVVVEDFPIVAQPTEWDTDDGLGWFRGLKNAVPFLIGFYVCVGIGLYLAFKK